ncbi:carboxypeptidase C [Longilinea arvoryzae]|uniref:Carboxypeptidase C n=1 Tax=Longilinea arvoryzae TaxID=360412 RepID=A0A0S7B9Y7_9CHLR|nr:peptidase S10 [Longilinea arvoryzae]GAP14263.1 carboxypeptidase C [Longilinea arvoryzae]
MTTETTPIEIKTEKKEKPEIKDQIVVTQHSITIGGEELKYTVTTGTLVLKEEVDREKDYDGEQPKAQFFFVAYTKDGVENPAERPLSFSFNGGPGSSSVWLHMGLLGPRRVVLTLEGGLPKPPFQLTDNEFSLLDQTDLVFIDPVGTGYSRPADGEKAKQFHGFKKDIETVGDFIRLYTTRYNRWLSPKFLIGESYGTTRASALSGYLQSRHGMYMNGIVLVSTVLDFGTIDFTPGNELPYVLFLPTYTATAWYHDALNTHEPLQSLLAEVEDFAVNEYAPALLKGNQISATESKSVLRKLARYTGLSSEYLERSNLRVPDFRFFKELLRKRGRTVGRLDSRFLGIDRDTLGEGTYNDPSSTNTTGPYTAGFYDYIRRELKFETDLPYEVLTASVWPWSYTEFENQHVFVAETLRQAMSSNPHLKVFIANGYYDLATPYFATQYVFNHLGLDPTLRGNISMAYYEAGHMMYIHQPALEQLKKDLSKFIADAR